MSDIILHHYPFSPFAEKARLALGLKNMTYHSVTIPVQSPKPELVALTGGYRRTPVLQHGADIYCDTLLILRVLEKLQPTPSLFPQGTLGTATAIGWWAEKFTYMPAVCLAFSLSAEKFPEGLVEERSKFFGMDLSKAATLREQSLYLQRLHAHLRWLADMLADGRPFLLGEQPGAADLSAYHSIWFIRENGGETVEAMLPLAPLKPWYDRVTAIGHGTPIDMSAEQARTIGEAARPAPLPAADHAYVPSGCALGDRVRVTADDSGRDPVCGALVGCSADDIVIALDNIHVHFPHAGFDVVKEAVLF